MTNRADWEKMSPADFREAVDTLRWSYRGLAETLNCDDRLVRRWASGAMTIPPEVATWLRVLAQVHRSNPPPENWRRNRQSSPAA